ncbi:hypothetical protein V8G54_009609, partial [Vigna mungo]
RETDNNIEDGVLQNYDGDIIGVFAQEVAKSAISQKEKERDISAEDKNCDGDIVGVSAQEVTKVVVSWGDSVVGCDVYVKTVKKGEDKGKKAEYGANRVTIMVGNKVEDATVLRLQFNIKRKQLAQHDDEEIGWSYQQILSFLAYKMNKSGQ